MTSNLLLAILLYGICASTFTVSKAALAYTAPIFFCAVRLLVASVILLLYQRLVLKTSFVINKHDIKLFLAIILFQSYIAYVADLWALQYVSSIESAFMYNLSPFFAAFFSYFTFNERFTIKKLIGLSIGFTSLIFLTSAPNTQELTHTLFYSFSWPELGMLLAVASSAYGWIIVRKLVTERPYTPLYVTSISMLGGGILALITSRLVEPWHPFPVISWPYFIVYTFCMVILAHIIFFNLYSHLLQKYTATFLSFAGFICPLLASVFGWLFLGEHMHTHFYIAAIAVTVGLYIFYQEELRQGYILDSSSIHKV